jgi:hypothetical protein
MQCKGEIMKKFLVAAVLALLLTPMVYGQDQAETQKPATKLEAFQARTGIIIVRGFTAVGRVQGMGDVSINALDYRDASNSKARITGVSITVTDRLERENTAFVDSDEIESLLTGLDSLSKATKDVTPLKDFRADYRTKGDLRITVFKGSSGELFAEVSAGGNGKTGVYIRIGQLLELRQLILEAKSKI